MLRYIHIYVNNLAHCDVLHHRVVRHNIPDPPPVPLARLITFQCPPNLAMKLVPCAAPMGPLEIAPVTSLAMGSAVENAHRSAFWGSDDAYYLRVIGAGADVWYRVASETTATGGATDANAAAAAFASHFNNVIPLGSGRVAFPLGSTGRRFYRIWRSGARGSGRTTIREVRAARSRRQPA